MEGKVFLCQILIWVVLVLGQLHGYKSCIQKEKVALLDLKQYLVFISDESMPELDGVKCNLTSRRVIGIAFGEPAFKANKLLNISLLHPFEEVRSLNISGDEFNILNGFFDDVEGYESLRRLRYLESLDLSIQRFNNSVFPFLNAATSLKTLIIRENDMNGPFPVKEIKDLTNLELLDLSRNNYNGSLPVFTSMKKLKALNLGYNDFTSSMELQELKNLTNFEVLSLAWNHFGGPIPAEVFCEMKNLRELDLRGNLFVGQIPTCLGSLNKLRVLDLSYNHLSGHLPSSFSNLKSLQYLSLSNNNFEGFFSLDPLANLTALKVFKLSSKHDMVLVETESNWQPNFQLSVAILRYCSLEKIPYFLVYQKNLHLVDLSGNRLSGNIPTWLLENNPELKVLLLMYNSFTIFETSTKVHNLEVLDISENYIRGLFPDNIGHALPSLLYMNGSYNGFQGNMPSSMGEMKKMSYLDFSYNNFSGELPRSFVMGCFSLQVLKLSHNKFSGAFFQRRTNLTSLSILKMDDNLFTGKIGVCLHTLNSLSTLDISNNRLTGAIPSWLPDKLLTFLLMSNNFLEGTLPTFMLASDDLSILDLSGNLLSGALPASHFPYIDPPFDNRRFFLQNNNFTGSIPATFLGGVEILDLRNNKLSGSIPLFVDTEDIRILLLSGNNLTGSIPKKLCELRNLRLLDLSNNKLTGIIPSCLNNVSFGLAEGRLISFGLGDLNGIYLRFYKFCFVVEEFVYEYSSYSDIEIKFAAKQRYDSYIGHSEFTDGTLDYMYGLDLSRNELSGVIPAELGIFSKLRALNLSRNFLSSSIPDSFSKLKDIESLDLSYNLLHGRIPQQLTYLTSLAVFNVSYNNLSGIIPQGVQFNTFTEDSYLGNPLLCGPPIHGNCEANNNSEEPDNGGEEDVVDMSFFYWSSALTYVTALIGILVLMCFDCPWRRAWLCLVDAFIVSVKSALSFSFLYIPM